MIPKTELELGVRAAEREKYVIDALRLYTKNTKDDYFHSQVADAMSTGKSAWGYLEYPQSEKHCRGYRSYISKAFDDLKLHGIFEVDAQYFYRNHSEFYKIRDMDIDNIELGLFASKRTYRVLTEISKYYSLKDYKLFGRRMIGKKSEYLNGFQLKFWKCKIRGYFYNGNR